MPAYQGVLPEVFPYLIRVPAHLVDNITHMLASADHGHPNGSSYAVTSDAPSGYRCIWLSEASYRTLLEAHIVPGLFPSTPMMSAKAQSFVDFVLAGGNPQEWKGDMPSPQEWAELKRRQGK